MPGAPGASGKHLKGSDSCTSRAAPRIRPSFRAWASAFSSTRPPRAVFTRKAPCLIWEGQTVDLKAPPHWFWEGSPCSRWGIPCDPNFTPRQPPPPRGAQEAVCGHRALPWQAPVCPGLTWFSQIAQPEQLPDPQRPAQRVGMVSGLTLHRAGGLGQTTVRAPRVHTRMCTYSHAQTCAHTRSICNHMCMCPHMRVKVAQSCLTFCDPVDYRVHRILQTRILEWAAFPFSRGSFQPRDQVTCTAGRFFTS